MEINGGEGVLLGLASRPSHVGASLGEGAQSLPGKKNDFLVVPWVAVCPEGVAGVVAAARCVMGVSGGLC